MFTNLLPSEVIDAAAAVDPDAYSTGEESSGYVDMSDYEAVLAVGLAGTIASSGKLDLKLQSNTTATGGSDVSGKEITQLTQASPDDSDKQALINLRRSELTAGHRYVKAVQTLTTAGADAATLLLGVKGVLVPNMLPSEVIGVVGTVDPDVYSPGAQLSDAIDMSKWHCAMGVLMIGDLGADGTVIMKWTQATTSGGVYKDVSGGTTATFTKASPDQSNQQVKLDLRAEDLDMANGYRYAKLSVTIGDTSSPEAATSDIAAAAFGVFPRIGVASDHDLSSVAEIVS